MKKIVCFGEVLWDMLPTGKKLGGAPLNVALRAQSLGVDAKVICAIGNDAIGQEILAEMEAYQASREHVQVSRNFGTSEVLVHLDDKGSASYEIKMPCAWDDIVLLEKDVRAVCHSDAFIYGSLTARSRTSRETLIELLNYARFKVFDVNLRPPHYNLETLLRLMGHADFIKFNNEEIFEICKEMGQDKTSLEDCIQFISGHTNTSRVCVTKGGDGAVLFQENKFYYNAGYKVRVADTVGAGDSFLATIISNLLNGRSPQEAINSACAIGALVASKSGANPVVTQKEVEEIML
jgi:fructokinase